MSSPLPNLRIPSDAELAEALALAGIQRSRAAEGNARRAAAWIHRERVRHGRRRREDTMLARYGIKPRGADQ
jgi:hypothetical protein